jgi:hypothetical protein
MALRWLLQNKVEGAFVSVMELSATGPTIRIKDLLVVVESFSAFVKVRAERLELACQEQVPIAAV